MTIAELIAKLEAASEGSAALDSAMTQILTGHQPWGMLTSYTTSLDAALSAVPPGTLWTVSHTEDGPAATVLVPRAGSYLGQKQYEAYAATPSLALCIAILRAKEQSE